jgi:hypothetical protein
MPPFPLMERNLLALCVIECECGHTTSLHLSTIAAEGRFLCGRRPPLPRQRLGRVRPKDAIGW